MNRRTAKKLAHYDVLPKRMINKYIDMNIRYDEYWSVCVRYGKNGGKKTRDCLQKVYIMAKDGRILVYSYQTLDGEWHYGRGYDYWHGIGEFEYMS